jgi:acetyl esterase/lipase
VAAIDYRLAMKGKTVKSKLSLPPVLDEALQAAVDDLFAATNYLIDHAETLGIDPGRIIVSGSSAGAMTALQAEWEICNGKAPAKALPGWFNYAGIMAFAGAVFSTEGPISFPQKPCPILLFYGTGDRIVPFGSVDILSNHFAGSATLAKKLKAVGANLQVYRYSGAGHEVSITMRRNVPEELRFLEENVIKGVYRPLDASLTDEALEKPGWGNLSTRDLYAN